jgi:hypothetical protein
VRLVQGAFIQLLRFEVKRYFIKNKNNYKKTLFIPFPAMQPALGFEIRSVRFGAFCCSANAPAGRTTGHPAESIHRHSATALRQGKAIPHHFGRNR